MQSIFQRWLERMWYGSSTSAWLLTPLETLYCFLAGRRRSRLITQQQPLGIPVIIVGNMTVGGTGKTPLVIRLTELLQEQGHTPAIITRGYKGKSSQWPLAVDGSTDVRLCGDEAKLLALRTEAPVIAGPDRVADVRYAMDNYDCNVVISDDGLQHYRLQRDLEIVVIDGERRFGNGHCLPAGPLREKPARIEECHFAVVNGASEAAGEYAMKVTGERLISIDGSTSKPLSDFSGVQIITGIGNPQRFIATLQAANLNIRRKYLFPDHHTFKTADFGGIDAAIPLVMTEKDAVKCGQFKIENAWFLPVNARLERKFETAFQRQTALLINEALI